MKYISKILLIVLISLVGLAFLASLKGCGVPGLSKINKEEASKDRTIRGGGIRAGK